MARRPGRVLAAALALTAMLLPAALLATQSPAAAASAQPSPVSLVITKVNPQWASPGSTITVTGSLTNTSGQPVDHLSVQLLGSSIAISSIAQMQANGALGGLGTTALQGGLWQASAQLAPRATARWSISVHANAIGMTSFGVYPLTAEVQSYQGPLASSTTYLPYMPAKKGAYGNTRPSPQKVAWVWPLIDKPLLNEPWQNDCRGPQAQALAQSLASGGRLSDLVGAGQVTAGQAEAVASQASLSRAARSVASRSALARSSQSLASFDGVTWAIDPALLANANALTTCGGSHPAWARAAQAWLAQVRSATAGQPLFVTPYGDPNLTALIAQGHGEDVQRSLLSGRSVAARILNRDVSPAASTGSAGLPTEASAIAWPSSGTAGASTPLALAGKDTGVRTLLLDDSALSAPAAVTRTPSGVGGYINVVLIDGSLSQLMGSATTAPGSGFATSQLYLAETALLAQQLHGQSVVVAPPRRWQPPAGLAADLLADTAAAPWLSPVTVTSLTSAKKLPGVNLPSYAPGRPYYSRPELGQFSNLDRQIGQIETLRASPDNDIYLALSAAESSAYQGDASSAAKGMIGTVSGRLAAQPQAVEIITERRFTLGGLKGSVPVSIENRLSFPVKVRLLLQYNQSTGTKITQSPQGVVTIPARTDQPMRLHVQATQTGSTSVTLSLLNQDFQPLPASAQMTVEATQVGVLGMIIFAAALGVFLIASAARAVRRGRPAAPAGEGTSAEPHPDPASEGGAQAAGPDTVMAERTELGTASTPRP